MNLRKLNTPSGSSFWHVQQVKQDQLTVLLSQFPVAPHIKTLNPARSMIWAFLLIPLITV
jgi:hypothetical protein